MKPDLHFSLSQTQEGFTTAAMSSYNDLNPATIVRELIQNSLDAVREDGRTEAVVRFEWEEIWLSDVPAIDTYGEGFKQAIQFQKKLLRGELHAPAKKVVDVIENCLGETHVEALFVLDNGLGLDKNRMSGLLSDGISAKSSGSSGAVGNGHLTAIPASDLRYVLYGGISAGGNRIASGHAILASLVDSSGEQRGKDGYYVLSDTGPAENRYDFPSEGDIAPLIGEKLDWIKDNFSSEKGTVVIIPGFNRFRQPSVDLWDIVKRAAACNFFVAIADGELRIQYEDGDGEKELNKSNIGKVLEEEFASEQRAKARNFLSGRRASEAYKTAMEGKAFPPVDVGCGQVQVLVRETKSGPSYIDLCRNGMWITDSLPRLSVYKFSDRKPFQCLIKVVANDGEIHSLIRNSEGPLHNNLDRMIWLNPEEKEQLDDAFSLISDFLSENLEELEEEEFPIDDYLTVMDEGSVGRFEEVPPRRPITPSFGKAGGGGGGAGGGGGGGGGGASSVNVFRRSGNAMSFGAVPVPTGARSYSVELHPQENLNEGTDAEIRFVLDENIDETCDPSNDEQFARLKSVKLNGKKISNGDLMKDGDAVLGVRLGQFEAGDKLSFDYDLPDGVGVQASDKVVLRAEIVRRRNQA